MYKHFIQPSDKIADFKLLYKYMKSQIPHTGYKLEVFRICYDEVMALLVTTVHCYNFCESTTKYAM
jgi:hypothetical protein